MLYWSQLQLSGSPFFLPLVVLSVAFFIMIFFCILTFIVFIQSLLIISVAVAQSSLIDHISAFFSGALGYLISPHIRWSLHLLACCDWYLLSISRLPCYSLAPDNQTTLWHFAWLLPYGWGTQKQNKPDVWKGFCIYHRAVKKTWSSWFPKA